MKEYNCQKCDFKTLKENGLTHHNKVSHKNPEDLIHPCDKCPKKFKTRVNLRDHKRYTHVPRFECDQCNFKTKKESFFQLHKKRKHSIHDCPYCPFKTGHKFTFRNHIKKHEKDDHKREGDDYLCLKCEYKTSTLTGIKLHIGKIHPTLSKYKCDLCDYSSDSQNKLRKHEESKHIEHLPYSCDICGKKFKYVGSVALHNKRQHGDDKFDCDMCEFSTVAKNSLQSHVNSIHTKENKFSCTLCLYVCYQKRTLSQHFKNIHDDSEDQRKFQCDQCEFKAKCKEKLKDHQNRVHVYIKAYKCELCDYSAKVAKDIKVHKNVHHSENVKTFKCTDCDYTSAWQPNVKRHFKTTHEKLKEYSCEVCGQNFTVKISLQKHQFTIHGMDEVPKYSCSKKDCSYQTIHPGALKSHVITNHETSVQKCDKCGIILKNSIGLKNHLRRMHSEEKKVYKCPKCPVEYFRQGTYKEHILVEHGEGELEEYKCSYCNWSSFKKSTWYQHERNHLKTLLKETKE